MNELNDNTLTPRLDDDRRTHEAQEIERRRQQQLIEDEERLALERERRSRGPGTADARAERLDDSPRQRRLNGQARAQERDAPDAASAEVPAAGNDPAESSTGIGPLGLVVILLLIAASLYAAWLAYGYWRAPAASAVSAAAVAPAPLPATVAAQDAPAGDRTAAPIDPAPVVEVAAPERLSPAVKPAPADVPEQVVVEVLARLDRLEAQLGEQRARFDIQLSEQRAQGDRLHGQLTGLRELLEAKAQPAAAAPAPAVATSQKRAVPSPVRAVAAKPAPQPIHNGQLLAVDMWNGVPSVVVGTGLPNDKRVRVLKPGDVYNGVALLAVDPAARTATFGANGRSFTLSVSQGG